MWCTFSASRILHHMHNFVTTTTIFVAPLQTYGRIFLKMFHFHPVTSFPCPELVKELRLNDNHDYDGGSDDADDDVCNCG